MDELALAGTAIAATVLVIIAYLALRSSGPGKNTSVSLEFAGSRLQINTDRIETPQSQIDSLDTTRVFADSQLGFSFIRPKRAAWSGPRLLRGMEELRADKGLIIAAEVLEQMNQTQMLSPIGQMSKQVVAFRMNTERSLKIEITDESTNADLEFVIRQVRDLASTKGEDFEAKDERELRRTLFGQGLLQADFRNEFVVCVYDKSLLPDPENYPIARMALTYLMMMGAAANAQKLEVIDDNIIVTLTSHVDNVIVNGKLGDLRVDRMVFFAQNRLHFYVVEIGFCHQTMEPLEVWQDLREMLNSFRIVKT